MHTLRPYQQDCVNKCLDFFRDKKVRHGIVIIPTGGGKSHCIAEIATQLNEPVCVFAPSKEITEQNYAKLQACGMLEISIFSASLNQKRISKITLATIGSAINKMELFKHFKHVIIDECQLVNHEHGMYKRFIQSIEGVKVIGFSATPLRLGINSFGSILKFLTRCKSRVFSEVIHVTQIKELADKGFFSPLQYHTVKGFDSTKLHVNSTGTGYTDDSIKKYYREILFENKLIKVVDRLLEINQKHILVFTKFVHEADVCAKVYGDLAAIVTGKTPKKERENIIKRFKSGEIKVVLNVGVFLIGFDFPELDCVVMARPTRSLTLWYQAVGRAVRPHKNKKYAMIIDLCNTYEMFGKVENLVVGKDHKGLPCIYGGEHSDKQLTNVYFNSQGQIVDVNAMKQQYSKV